MYRGRLVCVPWVIVMPHNPFALELSAFNCWVFSTRICWEHNSGFHQLWQVFQVLRKQRSPRRSHYHQHVLLLVWCSSCEMSDLRDLQKLQMPDKPLCSFWSDVLCALQLFHKCDFMDFFPIRELCTLAFLLIFIRVLLWPPECGWKVYHCYIFSPFVDNSSHWFAGVPEPQ